MNDGRSLKWRRPHHYRIAVCDKHGCFKGLLSTTLKTESLASKRLKNKAEKFGFKPLGKMFNA